MDRNRRILLIFKSPILVGSAILAVAVIILLQYGAEGAARSPNDEFTKAEFGLEQRCALLIEPVADLQAQAETLLEAAVQDGDADAASSLTRHSADLAKGLKWAESGCSEEDDGGFTVPGLFAQFADDENVQIFYPE